jgi:predicted flap endonuclease-1-like 5' DNA nuclease
MNDQMPTPTPAALLNGDQGWLTLPFALIALGVLFALYILVWGTRLARRRRNAQKELEERGEAHYIGDPEPSAVATPPVVPAPPPIAEAPPAMPPAPPEPVTPEPPIADEPIVAAAPLDASPAALAADIPESPVSSTGSDDLTRMKGVGPKLVDRLKELGITRFAQISTMTPDEAAALDAQLGNFQGRMHRDRWIEQARFLAADDVAGYEATFGKL